MARLGVMADKKHSRDDKQQRGYHFVKQFGSGADSPSRPEPGPDKTAREQIEDNRPVCGDYLDGHRSCPEDKRRRDHHEAAAGVFGTGTAWPDLVVAVILASLGIIGGVQIVGHALSEFRAASHAANGAQPLR